MLRRQRRFCPTPLWLLIMCAALSQLTNDERPHVFWRATPTLIQKLMNPPPTSPRDPLTKPSLLRARSHTARVIAGAFVCDTQTSRRASRHPKMMFSCTEPQIDFSCAYGRCVSFFLLRVREHTADDDGQPTDAYLDCLRVPVLNEEGGMLRLHGEPAVTTATPPP